MDVKNTASYPATDDANISKCFLTIGAAGKGWLVEFALM